MWDKMCLPLEALKGSRSLTGGTDIALFWNRNAELLGMFFKNANELFSILLYL